MLNKLLETTTVFIIVTFIHCNFVLAADDTNSEAKVTSPPEPEQNTSNSTSSTETVSPAVERSQFTSAIVNREPTDDVVTLTNNSDRIYFFSELSNLKGHTISHRWQYQGKVMAEIKFNVKSNHWRVYSSKNIRPDWTGEWTVELVDENGTSLNAENLQVVDAKSY